jgi:hypothetical protein
MSSAMKDKETCPRCMHPWDAHTEDVGCTIGHTNHWCQCDSSLRKYLDGVEQTSENRALALIDWETRCAQLEAERDALRNQIPPQGDGSCDRCGRVPSIAIPTSLCEECRDGVARAEKTEAELATARQTIERLSAPVSDAECNVVMFRADSGHTFGAILDALIAARKDANDKGKA